MYAIVENNQITQYINFPKSVVIGDVRYPAKIFELWSQSEKEAIGIYEIIVDKTNNKDPAYYNNTNQLIILQMVKLQIMGNCNTKKIRR